MSRAPLTTHGLMLTGRWPWGENCSLRENHCQKETKKSPCRRCRASCSLALKHPLQWESMRRQYFLRKLYWGRPHDSTEMGSSISFSLLSQTQTNKTGFKRREIPDISGKQEHTIHKIGTVTKQQRTETSTGVAERRHREWERMAPSRSHPENPRMTCSLVALLPCYR